MSKKFCSALHYLDPIRVENSVRPGTPDVNLSTGAWVELKVLDKWPATGKPVKIGHFTPQQRAWLIRRTRAGGECYVFLGVGGKQWLLIDGFCAATNVGYLTRDQLIESADRYWEGRFPGPEAHKASRH